MEHPADKGFNSTWEGFKHIASKAIKAAVLGAIVFAFVPAIVGSIGGGLASYFSVKAGAGFAWSAISPALSFGALVGGALGAISAVGGLNDAIEDARFDNRANYDQARVSAERERMLGRGQRVAMAGGVSSPSVGMGAIRSQGLGA